MTNDTSMNGYRFGELARGESLCSPEVCDCCGREGLKKTVKLISPEGRVVWFGVGCAARAMGCKPPVVRQARQEAIDTLEEQERRANWDVAQAEDARWQAWLDAHTTARGNRFKQIEELGGWTAARSGYRA